MTETSLRVNSCNFVFVVMRYILYAESASGKGLNVTEVDVSGTTFAPVGELSIKVRGLWHNQVKHTEMLTSEYNADASSFLFSLK